MTSVFYEDIKLCDSSIESIKKCELLSTTEQRAKLDKKREELMNRVSAKKQKKRYRSAYQR